MRKLTLATAVALVIAGRTQAAGPSFVDITWMSISNVYYEMGPLRVMTDGYFTRIPQSAFSAEAAGPLSIRASSDPVDARIALGTSSRPFII